MWVCTIAFLATVVAASTDLVVDTKYGKVSGWERPSRDGRMYQAWTAIPFAKPPVGDLRFKAPAAPDKWEGIYNATGDMPTCLQKGFTGAIEGVEDCLYLNVFRPKISQKKLPVLFHIYGGAFQGGGTGARENADYLMDENVVLVEVNYRVNVFGFGTLGDKVFPGNFGLKDNVLALHWVKENIEGFGGDAKSVTLFGESAGGQLAHHLLNSPLTLQEDLLHRAMSDSGSINHISSLMKVEEVKGTTLRVAELVGCTQKSSEQILACMRNASSESLITAVVKVGPLDMSKQPFAPVIEPADAEDAVVPTDLSLTPSNRPWVTRFSNGEFLMYEMVSKSIPQEWFENVMNNMTGYLVDWVGQHQSDPVRIREGAAILEQFYFPVKAPLANVTEEICQMHGGNGFVFPALFNIFRHKGPKWIASFEYVSDSPPLGPPGSSVPMPSGDGHATGNDHALTGPPGPPGPLPLAKLAGHAAEQQYYFYDPRQKASSADYRFSKRLIKYLVNFAYFDDPTPPGSSYRWHQFKENELFRITNEGDFHADPSYWRKWRQVLDVWSYAIGWK